MAWATTTIINNKKTEYPAHFKKLGGEYTFALTSAVQLDGVHISRGLDKTFTCGGHKHTITSVEDVAQRGETFIISTTVEYKKNVKSSKG
jgi:hypothetical protein|tara:strand:+ start:493 stop:762 length:270 start_codon:yes stop_codon:yes gene_type:complete